SLGIRSEKSFECRITPNTIKDVLNHSVCNPFSIFGNKESLRKSDVQKYKPISDQFSIVIHFIKKSIPTNKPNRREALRKYRATLWTETDTILKAKRSDSRITGIDVAGSELNCRPEIFAPMFRWAKSQGIGNNMTYHAGEDFYDILDGLRTIHETIIFMDFDAGCRIGHAIAIGKDPHKYYIERHHTIIAPAQIILDNLIWMRYFATELGIVLTHETQNFIDKASYDLFFNIGYDVNNHLDYWHSMLMRGNDTNYWEHDWNQSFTTRRLTARPLFWKNNNLVETQNAINLYKTYELNDEVYRNGLKPYQVKTPLSFANDVSRLQDGLMRLMRTSGIAIEANPSSNLKIGGMDKYKDLPLFRLFPFDENNENRMLVSINTDDRGVFATNLANEYSLIAASLIKQKDVNTGKPLYTITQIADYIRCIAENGKFMRFR
ncbi:MAG: hypothetical protein K2G11_01190, partial [Muribaculaceae bacterium]|nr:hypothetical protein [Muribaculaceae bacterium]